MDLGAYKQIDNLSKILEDNSINIPRLRGLRLMSNEELLTKDQIKDKLKYITDWECAGYIRSRFGRYGDCHEYSRETDRLIVKYLTKDGDVNWSAVHGKRRKHFKYIIKKARQKVENQYNIFNKYCGRNDVLYIHARLGAGNWVSYDCDKIIANQPWFLEKVEDSFDCTYVDIYARINNDGN